MVVLSFIFTNQSVSESRLLIGFCILAPVMAIVFIRLSKEILKR